MHRRRHQRIEIRLDERSAVLRELEACSEDGLRRRRSEQDEDLGANDLHLRTEPRRASANVCERGLLVDPTLATLFLPPEVLHRVRDVDVVALDLGALQRGVEEATRGTDERMALDVLPV